MPIITPGDFFTAYLRLAQRRRVGIVSRLSAGRTARVAETWSNTEELVRHWWQVPNVVRRTNERITGNTSETPFQYVARTFLSHGALDALSVGCGSGVREISWMETGVFRSMTALDLSEKRIQNANDRVAGTIWKDRLHFGVSDWMRWKGVPSSYDVVIAEGILHHLSPVQLALEKIHRILRPDGLLILNEYVGPSRFQWSREQRRMCGDALKLIPHRLRTYRDTHIVKRSIYTPGTLAMRWYDPSEAAESDKIVSSTGRFFSERVLRPYGGTLLHPVLKDIAHHFVPGDSTSQDVLSRLVDVEESALSLGQLKSDFLFGVWQKKINPHANSR